MLVGLGSGSVGEVGGRGVSLGGLSEPGVELFSRFSAAVPACRLCSPVLNVSALTHTPRLPPSSFFFSPHAHSLTL